MPQITSYNQLAAAAADDVVPIVDVHDDTMSPQGTTKKITVGTLNAAATGGVAISGTPSVGEILTATGPASADWQEPTPVIDTTASDIQPSPATQAAGATGLAADAGHVHGQPPFLAPTGLTGATAASRYAGATTSGAPVSGSFAKGDYVIDQTGAVWVCYNAGAPGNWQKGGGGGFTNPMTTLGDMIDGGASGTPTRLAGNTTTASEFLNSTGTGSAATAPAWKAIASTDLPLATTGAPGAVELAGDLGGTGTSPEVLKIQGTAITAFPGGTSQFLAGNGTWQTPAGSGGLPVYNVQSYGALGNGTTVDTLAVSNCAAAAEAAGGGIVFFPPGVYPISSSASATTVASGSNGVNVSTFTGAGTLNVGSTTGATGFPPAAGTLHVATSGTTAVITYTGTSSTTFTGCTTVSGSGTLSTGGAVSQPGVTFASSLIVEGAGQPGAGTAYPVNVTASNPTMNVTGVTSALYPAGQAVVLGAATIPSGFTDGQTYYIVSSSYSGGTWSFTLSATYGGSAVTPATTGATVNLQALVGGTTLLLDPAQKITSGPNTEVCRIAAPTTTGYTTSFAMRDLTIDGNSALWSPTDASTQRIYGFYVGQGPGLVTPVQNVTMENVTIQHCRTYAFDIENAAQITLINCTSANNGFTAGSSANASNADGFTLIGNDVTCIGCKSYGNAQRGFIGGQSATTYARIELNDCEAWGNGESGCLLGSGTGYYMYGARVNGGAYYSNGDAGIELKTNATACSVTGAYAYGNTGAGIILETGTGNVISGCTTYFNGLSGIEASGQSYCTITGNSCSADAQVGNDPGIYLTNTSTYCTVTGNTINGTIANHAIGEQSGGATNYNVIVGNAVTSASTPVILTEGSSTIAASNTGATSNAGELVPAIRTGSATVSVGELSACDTSTPGSAFTLTLPTAPASGSQYGAKLIAQGTDIDGTGYEVTIATGGTDVFNRTGGSTTATLAILDQGITLQYLAGSPGIWYVIGDDQPLGQLDARYGATISTLSSWTGAEVLNVATAQVWDITLSGNVTSVSFTNASFQTSVAQNLTLYISQPSTGGTYTYTVGGWTGVTWFGGSPPVIATGMSAMTVLTFQSLDGGQTWQGGIISNAALPLPVQDGGTGLNTLTTYELLAGGTGTTSPVQQIGAGTSGQLLTSGGSGVLPSWTNPSAVASPDWTPADQGLLGWTTDPAYNGLTSSAPLATASVLYVMAIKLTQSVSVGHILMDLTVSSSGATGGYVALYPSATGTLLAQSADQSATWNGGTGLQTISLGGSYSVPAGVCYVAVWFTGTTGPTFLRSTSTSLVNAGGPANPRWGTAANGPSGTTAPSTLGTITAFSTAYWAGLDT